MQPLFIQPSVSFEKTAAEVALSEDPNQWPQEILQELYKQVPYISDFFPQVEMQTVDSERGYALGQVTISSQSEADAGSDQAQLGAAGVRAIRIPVIIKERKLRPFDLLVTDQAKVLPLTESRLRQALFRPQAFDVTSKTPGDQSLIGQLYPPYRQNYGFGGSGVAFGSTTGKMASLEDFLRTPEEEKKLASHYTTELIQQLEARDAGFRHPRFKKTASLIHATFATYNQDDLIAFRTKLASDTGLQAAYRANHAAVLPAIEPLLFNEPLSLEKRASALGSLLKPSVTQLTKVATNRYTVKVANHAYWAPELTELDRAGAVERFGAKTVLAADESGQVTMTPDDPTATEEPVEESPEVVLQSGYYRVSDETTGEELVGCVIPNLLDTDGSPLPLALFTDGARATVQPDILGLPAPEAGELPLGAPQGAGFFYSLAPDGALVATIPLELMGSYQAADGEPPTFSGSTFDGRPIDVSVQPNLQTVMGTPEGRMLVPAEWRWAPLENAQPVALVSSESATSAAPEDWHEAFGRETPDDIEGAPTDAAKVGYVLIQGTDSGHFSFSGPAVSKLAANDTKMVPLGDAMFLLAGMGAPLDQAVTKLAHSLNQPQRLRTTRILKTASSQDQWALEAAGRSVLDVSHLRVDLSKEASEIPDPTTVDAVLSLGFINPENVLTYVSYLPTIEEAQSRLCELLMAARIGLSSVSASALERAVRSVEETIEGLKVLAFQGNN